MKFKDVKPGMTLVPEFESQRRKVIILRKSKSQIVFFLVIVETDITVIHRKVFTQSEWNDPVKLFSSSIESKTVLRKWLLKRIFTLPVKADGF